MLFAVTQAKAAFAEKARESKKSLSIDAQGLFCTARDQQPGGWGSLTCSKVPWLRALVIRGQPALLPNCSDGALIQGRYCSSETRARNSSAALTDQHGVGQSDSPTPWVFDD